MRKLLKTLFVSFSVVACLVISGCSCSNPMKISYNITTGQGNASTLLTSNIEVVATVNQKFREPADTPCYKKMKGGTYVELETVAERYICQTTDCYKKVSGKYVLMDKDTEPTKCIMGKITCYEKVEDTYYKLLEEPEGRYKCYTADGVYFEKATFDRVEKKELESGKVISTTKDKLLYNSNVIDVPSNKNYSLIYDFEIKNNENKTIYVEAIDFNDITGGLIKANSYSKINLTLPVNRKFMDNKFYYVINSGETIKIQIIVKNLLTSDANSKKTKELTLNIPIIVR